MTTKRNKAGFASLDLVLPVAPHYRADPQVLKDVEAMRTNAASRWARDDYIQSGYHNSNDSSSKIAALARPKVEILRANSPTLKRLVTARVKLEKIANTLARNVSASRQSIRSTRETPYPTVHEKQSSTISQPVHAPPPQPPLAPPPPASAKQVKSQTSLDTGPLDKITYEKVWSRSGNIKQKCSLEIWLPKPDLDDEDGNMSHITTPDLNQIEKKSQPIPATKSRRSSIIKITATSTVTNIDAKSPDDASSKKSEPIVAPRVYHYGDYIMDLPEDRPRSSKSVTTVKSDGAGSIRSFRRQQTRPHTRGQSVSTNHSEEILRFGTIEVPATGNNLSITTKPTSPNRETKTSTKSQNPSIITELMQKYSLIKKSHQELTQAKLQIEKPINPNSTKENSPRSRPPLIPESTLLVSSDQPTVSVKKLLIDSSSTRSTSDHNNTNGKLLERRSTPRKPSHSDIYPQLRIFSLANQRQHRLSSASAPTAALLPNVSGKKTDDTYRTLQRSKTLDVVLDIPNPIKVNSRIPRHPDNSSSNQRTTDPSPSRFSKRSAFNVRSDPPKQQQNSTSVVAPKSRQHFYNSSATQSVPTNKVFVNFNHSNNGNTDRNYFFPE